MRCIFRVHYLTEFGERLQIVLDGKPIMLQWLGAGWWGGIVDVGGDERYNYRVVDGSSLRIDEAGGPRRLPEVLVADQTIVDRWRPADPARLSRHSAIFSRSRAARYAAAAPPGEPQSHVFRLHEPWIPPGLVPAVVGASAELGEWDPTRALPMAPAPFPWWETSAELDDEAVEYKYVLLDDSGGVVQWESGLNLELPANGHGPLMAFDDGFRGLAGWRGAGVAIPVFSLRTSASVGVGQFSDLVPFADWVADVGMSVIQLLPVNDTILNHDWDDSYPYNPISVQALHPLYIDIDAIADNGVTAETAALRGELNDAAEIDYPLVMQRKMEVLKTVYWNLRSRLAGDAEFEEFVDEHWDWLGPYSAWSVNREIYGTPDFNEWGDDAVYDAAVVDARATAGSRHFEEMRFHWFVQYHLHQQLNAAAEHVRRLGLALKGDLPIGVAPESVEVWTQPELFNVGTQTGAPPDAFSTRGQNWEFPTYNWPRMAEDGYAWWQARFRAFAAYVDVYRIDHVLGFFRIWEIPPGGYDGLVGHFRPTMPLRAGELRAALGKPDLEALTKPFIDEAVIVDRFGEHAAAVAEHFFVEWGKRLRFAGELNSQRAIRAAFAAGVLGQLDQATRSRLERELLDLAADTLLLEIEGGYSPAIAWRDSEHYRQMPAAKQQAFDALALDFFHHRHDQMWEAQGRETLPAVVGATDLLACGEDLGMVPDIVPQIMNEMGLLSLEIERMPKRLGEWSADPATAPYLSVVSPGTHDTTTLRQWWREDPELIGRYWREALSGFGEPPEHLDGEGATRIVVRQLASPAMLCVLPIADLLATDENLRRADADAERINDPSNRHNPWKYRLHLTVEDLQDAEDFNAGLRDLITGSGRW